MTRTIRTFTAVTLAVALFLLGGIGLFRRTPAVGAEGPASPRSLPSSDVLVAPGVAARSLEASIASLQARLRSTPDDAQAAASLALAYVQQARVSGDAGLYPKAEALLERSLEISPLDNEAAWLGRSSLAAARHDFKGALAAARESLALAPGTAQPFGVLGDALLELGRYRAAFHAYQRMVDIEPGLGAYARASYALELQGDHTGAVRAMELAAGVAGTPADAAWAAYQLGELARTSGDVAGAAAQYRHAAALAPSWIQPLAGLARVAWARGDLDTAIARLRSVVSVSPLPEHVIALGDLLTAAGDRAGAAQQYDLARAETQLLAAGGVNVDLELALFEANHGDPSAAVRAARIEWSRRTSIHVADAYAWALHAAGRDRDAMPLIEHALSLGTRNASFEFHAGMIAWALGDAKAAARHLRAALAIDPHFSILEPDVARGTLRQIGAAR